MKHRLRPFAASLALLTVFYAATAIAKPQPHPNVIVILVDDQGYGDFSCHGNPVLKTPNLDRLHDQSVRLTDFHVAPLCTPTRSQIMTGRDSLANGAYCVCSGHGFVRKGMPTMADVFAASGYRTGLFGKWHLGDNYPYRPQDRGFHEVVTFGGWGLSSSLAHWDSEYMDSWVVHNGQARRTTGYCTDVFFNEAMQWMKQRSRRREPFFVYLPTNVPHWPLQVPVRYIESYASLKKNTAAFFGMIANLDENIGRLLAFLKDTELENNTIVIFMTDNGGTFGVDVYNAGMKGSKASYYDGGHRVPCFVRWPAGGMRAPGDVESLAQAQDLLPTLIDLCGLARPKNAFFDGTSFAPLLRGEAQPELAERMFVVQCALWDEYEKASKWAGAVLWDKWRLIKGQELYDLRRDPGQDKDIAAQHPEVVAKMRAHYEQWWSKVEPLTSGFNPIHLGSKHEKVMALNCHDWVAPNTSDQPSVRSGVARNGPWHVLVERSGEYEIALRRWPLEADLPITAGAPGYNGKLASYPAGKALPIASARLQVAGINETKTVTAGDKAAVFRVKLPAGRTTLQTWFSDVGGKELCGAYYVYVKRGVGAR